MHVIVWKRTDFRESSRLVTLVSRERGRFTALAKGAHRPGSAQLGRLDFLNQCDVQIAGRGMPLLGRTRLLHEPRVLREPPRFLVASHVAEAFDRVLIAERPDSDLFDLLLGALTLLEKAPTDRLPIVVLGIELRLLGTLGILGDLATCTACGRADPTWAPAAEAGLRCARHRHASATEISTAAAGWLRRLLDTPGRDWPALRPDRGLGEALAVSGRWSEAALEQRAHHRRIALARCATRVADLTAGGAGVV